MEDSRQHQENYSPWPLEPSYVRLGWNDLVSLLIYTMRKEMSRDENGGFLPRYSLMLSEMYLTMFSLNPSMWVHFP